MNRTWFGPSQQQEAAPSSFLSLFGSATGPDRTLEPLIIRAGVPGGRTGAGSGFWWYQLQQVWLNYCSARNNQLTARTQLRTGRVQNQFLGSSSLNDFN